VTVTSYTITKESVDDLWRVSKVVEFDGETTASEYFARELSTHTIRFNYQLPVSDSARFVCELADV